MSVRACNVCKISNIYWVTFGGGLEPEEIKKDSKISVYYLSVSQLFVFPEMYALRIVTYIRET